MAGELIPRSLGVPVPWRTQRQLNVIVNETRLQHAITRSMASAGQQAMFDALEVKNTQKQLEEINPDATEVVSLIANTVNMAIARSVQRFGSELGG